MGGTGTRSKNWLFILNNYTQHDLNRLHSLEYDEDVEFLVFARNVVDLRGTISFQSRKKGITGSLKNWRIKLRSLSVSFEKHNGLQKV